MKQRRTSQASDSSALSAGPGRAPAGRGNAAAQDGLTAKGGGPWPVPQHMEEAFGADFSHITIRVGGEAAGMGAVAYTQGDEIVFQPGAYDPSNMRSLEILGHELVHIFHQMRGQAGKGGLNTDPGLEAEADRLGAMAARGQKVSIGQGQTPRGASNAPIQRYAVQRSGRSTLRVSEDGRMAVREGYPNHDLWADSSLIADAAAKLKANGSAITLEAGSGRQAVDKPDGSGMMGLTEVVPTNSRTQTSGDSMQHYADCGRSTRDVMGGDGEKWGKVQATYNKDDGRGGAARQETAAGHRPGEFKREVFYDLIGSEAQYEALSADERRAFDEKAGINDFANPEVGEGFTMSSGGKPIAGYEDNTWNFHFAGLAMKSGGDFVTLENFSVSKPDVSNTDWTFDMYGPAHKEGQTFHDQHTATNQHGESPTTLAVKSASN